MDEYLSYPVIAILSIYRHLYLDSHSRLFREEYKYRPKLVRQSYQTYYRRVVINSRNGGTLKSDHLCARIAPLSLIYTVKGTVVIKARVYSC